MKKLAIWCLAISLPVALAAQMTVSGRVTDAETGEALTGANVIVEGTDLGAAADANGAYRITGVRIGSTLTASLVGYAGASKSAAGTVNFALRPSAVELSELEVIAGRAVFRESAVAFTNVDKTNLGLRLGSRDIPMILNTTPGVYATNVGGGAGDSRINIRGFSQRNIAVMINGVPVNDMENAWVYWSNWDGLGDVTSSLQVQRGMGISNLAIPSVGGTMNVITDPAEQARGGKFKGEAGSGSFLKSTLVYNTGQMANGLAGSFAFVRKVGDGLVDKTWTDGYAYYLALSYKLNDKNKLSIYGIGAPQQHGQRRDYQTIAVWNKKLAADEFDIDTTGVIERGYNFNAAWGPHDGDYKDYYALWTPTGGEKDVKLSGFMQELTNYFHKPQFNLNWHFTPNPNLSLFNVLYYSQGIGGGTGRLGSSFSRIAEGEEDAGQIDFAKVFGTTNATTASSNSSDAAYVTAGYVGANELKSKTILRNSVNQHRWFGDVLTARYRLSDEISLTGGFDWRSYVGEHWREIRNLLGGEYYTDTSNKNEADPIRRIGDKVGYDNDGKVKWLGFFGQGEYKKGPLAAFGSASWSNTQYMRVDRFIDLDGDDATKSDETDWVAIAGYSVKGGANYNISDALNAYANVGISSKAPLFDAVFDFSNKVTKDVEDGSSNENVNSFELGLGYRAAMWAVNANVYNTQWLNRTFRKRITYGSLDYYYIVKGIDAGHSGIEIDARVTPMPMLDLSAMISLGNWEWLNDVESTYDPNPDDEVSEYDTLFIYTKGLKVGDAAQKTLALTATVRPMTGVYASVSFKNFSDYFAEFDPTQRTAAPAEGEKNPQSWEAPSYNVVDLHAGYAIPVSLAGTKLSLALNAFNLLDAKYITDAIDGSAHDAATAKVFFGLPRSFNLALNVSF